MGKRSRNRSSITRRRGFTPTVTYRLLELYPESLGDGQALDSRVNKFIIDSLALPDYTLIQASAGASSEYPSVTVSAMPSAAPFSPKATYEEIMSNEDHAAMKQAYQSWRDGLSRSRNQHDDQVYGL